MANYLANQDLMSALADLKVGLHLMMDSLIRSKDYAKAEFAARQMDEKLTHIVNKTRIT
jgi:hypothetical protein